MHLYKKENIKAEYFVFGRYAVRPIKLWSRKTTVRLKLWSIDWPMNIKQMSCTVASVHGHISRQTIVNSMWYGNLICVGKIKNKRDTRSQSWTSIVSFTVILPEIREYQRSIETYAIFSKEVLLCTSIVHDKSANICIHGYSGILWIRNTNNTEIQKYKNRLNSYVVVHL